MFSNSSKRLKPDDLQIDQDANPEWVTGNVQLPAVGERVLCTNGMAEVVKVLGKTSDGSRLLELRLVEEKAPPFFASSSNVLLRPTATATTP